MVVFNSIAVPVRIELTSADIGNALCAINSMQIRIKDLYAIDDLTVQFTVLHSDMKQIETMAQQRGDHVVVLSCEGIFWTIRGMKQRPVLLLGITVLMLLAVFLPSRVLFVEVEGNEKIPESLILEAARDAGIGFCDSRRAVRSEKVKNQLLATLPQLQWAGVNTYGCTAVISVKERSAEQEIQHNPVSHVIASGDGVITSCVVTSGTGLCAVGQVVKKGQILISGYTDCGGVITAGRGQGEVFAQTRYKMTSVTPAESRIREETIKKQTYYSLHFGKKRINFYKGSGISDGSCVKMIEQYHLTLPGDYTLPVMLVKEEQFSYKTVNQQSDQMQLTADLSLFARDYIRDNGVALMVVEAEETVETKNDLIALNGIYSCTEMIGREQGVQIGDFHGKTD